jgi:hypothetical protein
LTTGPGVQAHNIEIGAPLTWSTGNTLTLDAHDSIRVQRSVTVSGSGGLSVTTDDGGNQGGFSFGAKGKISFEGTSSVLSINGSQYTLLATLPALASAIAADSSGYYALSHDYNAGQDGKYHSSPITTIFEGNFNGLGNTISNLKLQDKRKDDNVGLFSETDTPSIVASVRLSAVQIEAGSGATVSGLVGFSKGTIFNSSVKGTLDAKTHSIAGDFGGVVGANLGTIDDVVSNVTIDVISNGRPTVAVGGAVGANEGTISESYSIKPVMTSGTSASASVGALLGVNAGTIEDCYATGAASEIGGDYAEVGGLVGTNISAVDFSYSTGNPTAGADSDIGGLIGYDIGGEKGDVKDTYWDTTTSGIANLSQGAGNIANDPGIKGTTTAQLQAKLPKGFDRLIWAENPKFNNALPYLIANPPSK